MNQDEAVRQFYRRLAAALPNALERNAFEAQIDHAVIVPRDKEHDRFELPSSFSASSISDLDTVEAVYIDSDGEDVNVIVHCVKGLISWAERYRDVGPDIRLWPPPMDAHLRLARNGPPS